MPVQIKKINSILIANRGEIAVRIIRTAKTMGIKTYAIKTVKEPTEMYLQLADEVLEFPASSEEIPEFLDVENIIQLAVDNKVDAIHPGYGFLAENPYFARCCKEVGIIFIGPSASAIYKMGNKTIAKQIAHKQGVPLLKGSFGSVKSVEEAEQIAKEIGYPVILKAASGGGGRGMRIVSKAEEMKKMFRLATTESEKAFNDPSLFIEKYVKSPRHIEFQILADQHGNIVHLGERECSIQRKHQKLIEEAPSSALSDKLREVMGKEALKIASAVKYYSTGTVEFLLDSNNNFYFMEMNTRIQVEHPITEMITGIDLIEWQIRIAAGEKIPFKQKDIKIDGWAIECRINAEDVQSNFSPCLGSIEKLSVPHIQNVRIDTGIREGSEITPYFDSMVAKLIVHGETREKAINLALTALRKIKIKGLKTTIPFCKVVLTNKAFKQGKINTSFIEKELDTTYYQEPDEELLAALFVVLKHAEELRSEKGIFLDYEKGKNLTPWLLNRRIKSL